MENSKKKIIPKKRKSIQASKTRKITVVSETSDTQPKYFSLKTAIVLICTVTAIFIVWYGLRERTAPQANLELNKSIIKDVVPLKESSSDESVEPEIESIKISPASPKKGDIIKADVVTKNSGSSSLKYQWSRNGEVLHETSDSLSADFNKGDKIVLVITLADTEGISKSASASVYIFNSQPLITSKVQDSKFSDGFVYQVRAVDVDNDTLLYSLKISPEGMTIDPQTGLLKWRVPYGYKGKAYFIVHVSDGAGGEDRQILNLQINDEQKNF